MIMDAKKAPLLDSRYLKIMSELNSLWGIRTGRRRIFGLNDICIFLIDRDVRQQRLRVCFACE